MTQNRRKILYVITKSGWGGAGRYVCNLASHLPSEQFDVAVLLGGEGPLKTALEEEGVRTISLSHLQRDVNVEKELRTFSALYRIFRKERPDIVHLNSSKIGGLGSLAARIARVPLIVFTAHGWYFNEERGVITKGVTWFLSLLTQLFSHKTITVSEFDRVRSPLKRRSVTIHNGVAPPSFLDRATARERLLKYAGAAPVQKTWVGTLAELHKNKGISYLIDACATLENLALFILGEGEERERLSRLIAQNGIADRVFLPGHIPDGAQYLRAFDIFALPSTKEGFPYALLEAGAAQLPVIATRVGGTPEIIQHERTGVLVPAKNSAALREALERLSADPKLRAHLAHTLEEAVRSTFTLETMLQKTRAVYTSRRG